MASERLRRSFLLLCIGLLQLGLAACGSIPVQFKSGDRTKTDVRDTPRSEIPTRDAVQPVLETEPRVRHHADAVRHFRHANDPQWLLVAAHQHGAKKDVAYWSRADFIAMRSDRSGPERTPPSAPRAMPAISMSPTLAEALTVRFEFDSARLSPTASTAIRQWLQVNRPASLDSVKVVGHADAIGADHYNLVLSTKRAFAVAAAIEDGGVDRARIEVFAKGEAEPAASNATPEGRAANRRVNVQATLRAPVP